MTESHLQLQNALTTTFLANLAFLSEYDNTLYHRVDELSRMIEIGTYQEKYTLDFIQENGEFDIYDIENDSYIYNKKAKEINSKALSSINFNTKGSFSILEQDYFADNVVINNNDNIFNIAGRKLIKDITELKVVLGDDLSNYKNQKLKYINKFMFIGTLLGRHIPLILEKTQAKNFFVCEKNLEIFRLSLFTVDFSNLARDGKTVVFSIMDDTHIFNSKCSIFLRNDFHQNYSIKYYTTDINVSKYFDEIMDCLVSESSVSFNHYMMLDNVAKLTFSRIKKFNIIRRNIARTSKILLHEKPVLFVGAGPSLSDNIEWISANQDKFIIVAMGASCKKLLSFGIIPDIVTTLDPQFETIDKHHFPDEFIEKLNDTIVLASINTDERILNKFDKNNLFLFEVILPLDSENKLENGFSIGEITGSLLLNLGVKELYIIGIDLSLNQETGESHISDYAVVSQYNLSDIKSSMEKNSFSLREDVIKVKGNFLDEVYTTRLFNTSLISFSFSCECIKRKEQNIYNLSKNGAYIAKTIPTNIDEIDLNKLSSLEKKKLAEDLKKDFLLISKDYLTSEILKEIEREKEYLFEIKNELDFNSEIDLSNFSDFSDKYLEIEKKLISPEIKTIFTASIFSFYYRSITPYIYYHFNNTKIKKENKKINKINKIMNEQLIILIDKYVMYLDEVISK